MALDSATKRRSMLAMGVLALVVHPVPDGTIAAIDQKHFLGLMAAVSTTVGTRHIHKFSTGPVEPNHAADSGDNVLYAGVIEAQEGGYFGGPDDYVELTADGNALIPTGKVSVGPTPSMLALLNITGDTANIGDRHEVLWMRSTIAAWIVQINVRGPRLEIGGGATLDAAPTMSVDYNTGKVGIGTNSPDRTLEVYGVGPIIRIRSSETSGDAAAYVEFGKTTGGDWVRTGWVGDAVSGDEDIYLVAKVNDLHLGDSSGTKVVNLSGGDVGIGTLSPDEKLQVVGSAKFGDDDTNYTKVAANGDLTFHGGAGLAFGCLKGIDETITCTVEDTWYQVTFDAGGVVNLVEADVANNELDVTNAGAGAYMVSVVACLHSNPSNDFELMVKKNDGTADLEPHLFQTTAVADKVENCSGTCLIDVTGATDRIELWVRCTSAAGQDAVFDHVSLAITQVGGT